MQISSIDTQWHLVHPWHQDPMKTVMREGRRSLFLWCLRGVSGGALTGSVQQLLLQATGRSDQKYRAGSLLKSESPPFSAGVSMTWFPWESASFRGGLSEAGISSYFCSCHSLNFTECFGV